MTRGYTRPVTPERAVSTILASLIFTACSAPPADVPVVAIPASVVPKVDVPSTADVPAIVPPVDATLALLRAAPTEWTNLRERLPKACFHIGYHTADNFTGAPLPGYGAPGAWLRDEPAKALAEVESDAEKQGLVVIIYDSYRPYRATRAMVAWATRTGQVHLLDDGYIARQSRHNFGTTVDLGLARPDTCEPVEMGTPWDTLDERAHTKNATGDALKNRLQLKSWMSAHGFTPYFKEWWHFEFPLPAAKLSDVPYACFEADEGQWKPPKGWAEPGYVAASTVDVSPCTATP